MNTMFDHLQPLKLREAIQSIHRRVEGRRKTAVDARNREHREHHRLMLAGKVKAYTDVLCLLQDRYQTKQSK